VPQNRLLALGRVAAPDVSVADLQATSDQLDAAAKKLDRLALTDTVRDRGFSSAQVDEITAAHGELIAGLRALATRSS